MNLLFIMLPVLHLLFQGGSTHKLSDSVNHYQKHDDTEVDVPNQWTKRSTDDNGRQLMKISKNIICVLLNLF